MVVDYGRRNARFPPPGCSGKTTNYTTSRRTFLDPPYCETEGDGVPFGIEQYVRMACCMRGIKGRAILTVNDPLDMLEVFAGLDFERAEIQCTAGGAGPTARRRGPDFL